MTVTVPPKTEKYENLLQSTQESWATERYTTFPQCEKINRASTLNTTSGLSTISLPWDFHFFVFLFDYVHIYKKSTKTAQMESLAAHNVPLVRTTMSKNRNKVSVRWLVGSEKLVLSRPSPFHAGRASRAVPFSLRRRGDTHTRVVKPFQRTLQKKSKLVSVADLIKIMRRSF